MTGLWLNLGCGDQPEHRAPAPWINVDGHAPFLPDVVATLDRLPWDENAADRIYLGHVLEHIPYAWSADHEWDGWDHPLERALAEVRRVLSPDGELVVVGPCIERAIQTGQPEWLLRIIAAPVVDDQPPGLNHAWTPTTLLHRLALDAVFANVVEVPVTSITKPEWPNPSTAPWQCAFRVRHPH
jgi:predicted SAM-dependent methyltransferase